MKVKVRIHKIIPWEKRRSYSYISKIKNREIEYDFAILRNIFTKPKTITEHLKILLNGHYYSVNQCMIAPSMYMPIQRPHNFKKGDIIEMEINGCRSNEE